MALKIDHIDVNKVQGVLDDALIFEVEANEGRLVARVGSWVRDVTDSAVDALGEVRAVGEMRAVAYLGVAQYRADHKASQA